ncbi:hypothetical protein [Hominenteromicrobium sp.]
MTFSTAFPPYHSFPLVCALFARSSPAPHSNFKRRKAPQKKFSPGLSALPYSRASIRVKDKKHRAAPMQALPARLLLPVNSGQGYTQILAMEPE